jgi:cysteinyl-tRNA synthetase
MVWQRGRALRLECLGEGVGRGVAKRSPLEYTGSRKGNQRQKGEIVPIQRLVDEHLFLHNTLSRRKELFRPMDKEKVLLFTCGPSVYLRQHLGNYRTFLYEDVLHRYLQYRGYTVERLISITDIEDKAIGQAQEEGMTLDDLTTRNLERYIREAETLRISLPATISKASSSVDEAVELICKLLETGVAYRQGGDVFFDALKFDGFGKLFGLDLSAWPVPTERFAQDTYPGQRWNLGDFVLWHAYSEADGEFYWDTRLGRGRPSWNIQDQAMILKHLGQCVDIHCGGADNLFRHHDYTLAVMETFSGCPYARYWLHGDYLLIDGVKMSKSLGNIVHPEDGLSHTSSPAHLRYFLISAPYREPLDMTSKGLTEAGRQLDDLREMIGALLVPDGDLVTGESEWQELSKEMVAGFERAMNNDLDVVGAVDALRSGLGRLLAFKSLQGLGNRDCAALKNILERFDSVLQVLW